MVSELLFSIMLITLSIMLPSAIHLKSLVPFWAVKPLISFLINFFSYQQDYHFFLSFFFSLTAISQVEHWLENLHDRRRLLEIAWQSRKSNLEQCLALTLLATDLKELEELLLIRKEALTQGSDHLGDSPASAELLLHEHKKLLPEAKVLFYLNSTEICQKLS